MDMPLTLLNWTLALLPVLTVLVLMLALRWGGGRAGAASWFVALLSGVIFFGAEPHLIALSQGKGLLLSLDVLYIIWGALLLFHIADEAGAVAIIGRSLTALTADRTLQSLLVGWVFCSFLQGMGGFGVPIAVTAPLLVGLGFKPIQAVVMASVGHGWAVNYGSLATSYQSLLAVTNLPGELLAADAAILLGISCYVGGLLVAVVASGWKGLLRGLPAVAILGTVMAGTQYLLATNRLWTVGATGAALAGLAAGILVTRLPFYRNTPEQTFEPVPGLKNAPNGKPRSLVVSLSSYTILIVLAFSLFLIRPVAEFLTRIQITVQFPEMSTALGFITPAEAGRIIYPFGHPGAILLYSSLLAYLVYSRAGYYLPGAFQRILTKVSKGALNSSLGILAMVGMAVIMSHTGMTHLLALGISQSVGREAYPLVAPFIGGLGAFITGSNNNANVLFGMLQLRTAELLGLSVSLILGAQTSGGSLASVLSPAKVIVGCSTVGLSGQEGLVMRKLILIGLVPVAVVAVAAWMLAFGN